MNDFVTGVVNQILGNESKAPGPASHSSATSYGGIQRPNYQREKAKSRYSLPVPVATSSYPSQAPSSRPSFQPPASQTVPIATMQRQSAVPKAEPYTDLRQILLKAQVPSEKPAGTATAAAANAIDTAIISAADKKTAALLGVRFAPDCAIGLAWQKEGCVESLLAASNVQCEFPSLDSRLCWREEDGKQFLLALSGDVRDVSSAIAAFSKQTQGEDKVALCREPTAYLQRRMRIDRRQPLAAFGPIGFASAVELVNRYYLDHPQTTIEFYPGDGYLAAQGEADEIKEVLIKIKSAAAGKGVVE